MRGKKRRVVLGGEWVRFSVEGLLGIWCRAGKGERRDVWKEMMLRNSSSRRCGFLPFYRDSSADTARLDGTFVR